ncbi:MAG: hypothetical protein ACP5HQ_07215 [Thermoprotei archaeon]
MRLKVCLTDGKACGGYSKGVCTDGKSVVELEPANCLDTEFEVKEKRLYFDDLYTLLPYDEAINNARAVLVALGETRNEAFFYGNAKVFVKPKLFQADFEGLKRVYARECGEYGSAIPHYCIHNQSFYVLSRKAREAEEALSLFRRLVDYVKLLRLSVGCGLNPCF